MKIHSSLNGIKPLVGSVVTIGIFDGVHTGHKKIIAETVRRAKALNVRSVLITFNSHPLKVLRPSRTPATLISLNHRIALIEDMGLDVLIAINFTKEIASLKPHEFVKRFLVERLGAKEVVVGGDFRFGAGRKGDIKLLRFLGAIYGFKVAYVKAVRVLGHKVSSSLIRSFIMRGDLAKAQALLGRPVSIFGTVVHGAKIGRILGYPTANINPHHEAVPPSGVYAVRVKYGEGRYGGVMNIGFRPTLHHEAEPVIEVHLFDFKKKGIYGRDLQVDFARRLRPERRFGNKEALIAQIRRDSLRAQKLLNLPAMKAFTFASAL